MIRASQWYALTQMHEGGFFFLTPELSAQNLRDKLACTSYFCPNLALPHLFLTLFNFPSSDPTLGTTL